MVHQMGPMTKKRPKTTGSHSDQIAVLAMRPEGVVGEARHRAMTAPKPTRVTPRSTGRVILRSRVWTSDDEVTSIPGGAASSPTPPKMCSARISLPSATRTARSRTSRSSATLRRWYRSDSRAWRASSVMTGESGPCRFKNSSARGRTSLMRLASGGISMTTLEALDQCLRKALPGFATRSLPNGRSE